ncbi:hypothetical protein EDD15DRAFT_2192842 [Pisolithus albus]|nr:hypothetical protein EDD15DRAFT_2192842 [Pisolithus albus]
MGPVIGTIKLTPGSRNGTPHLIGFLWVGVLAMVRSPWQKVAVETKQTFRPFTIVRNDPDDGQGLSQQTVFLETALKVHSKIAPIFDDTNIGCCWSYSEISESAFSGPLLRSLGLLNRRRDHTLIVEDVPSSRIAFPKSRGTGCPSEKASYFTGPAAGLSPLLPIAHRHIFRGSEFTGSRRRGQPRKIRSGRLRNPERTIRIRWVDISSATRFSRLLHLKRCEKKLFEPAQRVAVGGNCMGCSTSDTFPLFQWKQDSAALWHAYNQWRSAGRCTPKGACARTTPLELEDTMHTWQLQTNPTIPLAVLVAYTIMWSALNVYGHASLGRTEQSNGHAMADSGRRTYTLSILGGWSSILIAAGWSLFFGGFQYYHQTKTCEAQDNIGFKFEVAVIRGCGCLTVSHFRGWYPGIQAVSWQPMLVACARLPLTRGTRPILAVDQGKVVQKHGNGSRSPMAVNLHAGIHDPEITGSLPSWRLHPCPVQNENRIQMQPATLGDTPHGGARSPIATPWVHVTPPPHGCSRIRSGDREALIWKSGEGLPSIALAPSVCLFCDATVSPGGYAGQRPINASNAKHINPTSTPNQTSRAADSASVHLGKRPLCGPKGFRGATIAGTSRTLPKHVSSKWANLVGPPNQVKRPSFSLKAPTTNLGGRRSKIGTSEGWDGMQADCLWNGVMNVGCVNPEEHKDKYCEELRQRGVHWFGDGRGG